MGKRKDGNSRYTPREYISYKAHMCALGCTRPTKKVVVLPDTASDESHHTDFGSTTGDESFDDSDSVYGNTKYATSNIWLLQRDCILRIKYYISKVTYNLLIIVYTVMSFLCKILDYFSTLYNNYKYSDEYNYSHKMSIHDQNNINLTTDNKLSNNIRTKSRKDEMSVKNCILVKNTT